MSSKQLNSSQTEPTENQSNKSQRRKGTSSSQSGKRRLVKRRKSKQEESSKQSTQHPSQKETQDLPIPMEDVKNIFEKARLNLVTFRHVILQNTSNNVSPADYHYDWSDSILTRNKHEVWECYRESAKTQIVLRSFPLYQLMFPQSRFDYIVLIKANQTLASAKLKEISKEYQENVIASTSLERVVTDSHLEFHVEHKPINGEKRTTLIQAYGKGASVRGISYVDKRPKIVIIDDPQDTEDAKSDLILENDWKWFLSDVLFLGKTSRIFLIGNNLGDRCIVERVMKNAEALGFNKNRIAIEENGKPTWPSKFSMDSIIKEKEAFRRLGQLDIWLRERMCQSTSEETRTFKMENFPRFSYLESNRIAMRARLCATLDPAASTTLKACYRAICVNAVTPENHWFILDMPYGRWDSTVLIDKIFETVSKWGLKELGIEKGMLKDFMEPIILAEMVRRKIFFTLVPIEHAKRGTKLERIKMLAPRANTKSIWLPDYADPVDGMLPWITELESELLGVTKDEIKSEFIDLADSLAMQDQIAQPPSVFGLPEADPSMPGFRGRPALPRTYQTKHTFGKS